MDQLKKKVNANLGNMICSVISGNRLGECRKIAAVALKAEQPNMAIKSHCLRR